MAFAARAATPDDNRTHASMPPAESIAARSCPQLFGRQARRAANKERRERLLHFAAQDRRGILVAHASHRWQKPAWLRVSGAPLIGTHQDQALVEVSPTLARRVGCAPGVYRLTVDDSIGKATLLAVLNDVVLVERIGRLRYLRTRDKRGPHPSWLMAWGSRYEVNLRKGTSGGSPTTKHTIRSKAKIKPPKVSPRPRRGRKR